MAEIIKLINNENDNTITDTQIHEVYNKLDEENTSKEALENAQELTESSDYTEVEKIENSNDAIVPGIGTVNLDEIKETDKDYKEVLDAYNLSEEDAVNLIEVINKYKKNKKINYYELLPESIKAIADGFRSLGIKENYKMGKNEAAKAVLSEFIHDAQLNNTMDAFSSELNNTIAEMNAGYDKLLLEAFDDAFSKLDSIEAENPEQAAKIRLVKESFEEAITFNRQKAYVEKTSANKIRKFVSRYKNEVSYFNNRVNVTDVKIPDINELFPIIHNALPHFTDDEIKKFIIVICKSSYDLDVKNNIGDLAYIYKLVSNIYGYKFTNNFHDETATKIFGNIAEVITCIIYK